jgi:hypothetical protein
MNPLISNGVPFDSAQGTPFIDFLGFHCVLKRTVLTVVLSMDMAISKNSNYFDLRQSIICPVYNWSIRANSGLTTELPEFDRAIATYSISESHGSSLCQR